MRRTSSSRPAFRFTQTADLVLTRELGKAVAAELAPAPAISLVNPWDYLARSLA
jgi:hypothetical protein